MQCIKCGNEDLVDLGSDVFTCDCCGDTIKISYLLCENCLITLRLKNGKLYDYIELGPDGEVSVENESPSMSDLINTCLRCAQPAIKEGKKYVCPYCGFSWEVLD